MKDKGGKQYCSPFFWLWPGGLDIYEKEGTSGKGWVKWKTEASPLYFLYWVFKKITFAFYSYVLPKILLNGAMFIKTDSWFQRSHEELEKLEISSEKSKKLKFDGLHMSKKYIPSAKT